MHGESETYSQKEPFIRWRLQRLQVPVNIRLVDFDCMSVVRSNLNFSFIKQTKVVLADDYAEDGEL